MKKVTISVAILLLAILTIFTSCSKDDETKIENWIVGTWNMGTNKSYISKLERNLKDIRFCPDKNEENAKEPAKCRAKSK